MFDGIPPLKTDSTGAPLPLPESETHIDEKTGARVANVEYPLVTPTPKQEPQKVTPIIKPATPPTRQVPPTPVKVETNPAPTKKKRKSFFDRLPDIF